MPRSPAVSVIMAAYNAAAFIGAAIEGLLEQNFADWELVIRNDESTDHTVDVIERYDDDRIRLLPQQQHVGAASARNDAIAAARASLLAIHDADDLAHPERLSEQVRFLNEHPDVAVVGSAARLIDASGRTIGRIDPPTEDADIRAKAFEQGFPFVHSSIVIRADAFRAVGGYDTRFVPSEDYDMLLRLLEGRRAANLPEPLCSLRRHGGSLSVRRALRQTACAELARERSAVRRAGNDPDSAEHAQRFTRRFEQIARNRYDRPFRRRAWLRHAQLALQCALPGQAARCAVRALRAGASPRDAAWILRKAARLRLFGRRGDDA